MRFDPIAAVEACYAPAADDRSWLSGILEALRPIDRGLGVYAEEYDAAAPGGFAVAQRVATGGVPEGVFEELDQLRSAAPRDVLLRLFSPPPPVAYSRWKAGLVAPEFARQTSAFLRRWGARDSIGMFASDPGGRTILVVASIPIGKRLPPPGLAQRLERISAHLVSGFRLRRAIDGRRPALEDAEAVLDASGRTLSATGAGKGGAVRDRLALAARHMDRARGKLRVADPDEALELWKGLVDGTWSLIDHADSDGRRHLLARRNQPGVQDPKALTPRERHVLGFAAMGHQNKYIGYLLGLAASTVAVHLESARRKLGLASRREIIETFAPHAKRASG